jgi:hypothetical protein
MLPVKVEIKFAKKSYLIQNKNLVAFLHNTSTAFVKIPEVLKIIPKYLYSIPRSILLFLYKKLSLMAYKIL